MTDYKELIQALRNCDNYNAGLTTTSTLESEAADAIEELQEIVKEYKTFDLYLYVRGFRWNEKERKWRDVN